VVIVNSGTGVVLTAEFFTVVLLVSLMARELKKYKSCMLYRDVILVLSWEKKYFAGVSNIFGDGRHKLVDIIASCQSFCFK